MTAARSVGGLAWAVLLSLSGGPGHATPDPTPPPDFLAAQYVGRDGCAFVRMELEREVMWLPRLDAAGRPFCGLTPSLDAQGNILAPQAPVIVEAQVFPEPGLYVQAGAFSTRDRAEATGEALIVDGYPVLIQDLPRAGRVFMILFAGPFDDPLTADNALQDVRGMGFGDAFIRVAE